LPTLLREALERRAGQTTTQPRGITS
jgi:hypothetical protein